MTADDLSMARRRNRRLIEAFASRRAVTALADDVIIVDQAQSRAFTGRAAAQTLIQALFVEGFTHVVLTPLTVVVDEQTAVLEFQFRGRQTGRFLGIPATSRVVDMPMTVICHIGPAGIQRATLYYDAGTVLRQLGIAL